ncbi:hypothetical protein ACJMK2_021300 [Sinanodonta woodiana]|uniref:EF-hand domain-containing protein n=1 Tax=Sinanodonta woodiana TaxID=1069815 RepID=A0ABD3THN0_SINWO
MSAYLCLRDSDMTTEQDKKGKLVDTTFGLSEEQLKAYRDAFDQFDKDGNGYITMSELMTVMKSLGYNPSKKTLERIIKEVDMDDSGTVDFSEFLILMVHHMRDEFSHEDLKEIFSVIDKNGDGYICADDLRQTLRSLDFQLSYEDVSVMMAEADVSGEGNITFEDFVNIMLAK